MSISMETSLPENVLESLNKFADVRVIDGEIPIYNLVDSRDGYSLFLGFLGDDKEQDPLIYPSFGDPCNPYVSPVAQVEIFNLLATFQKLMPEDLVEDVFPFIEAKFPIMGGFQYHHTKSIQTVQLHIKNPSRFVLYCPCLLAIPNGTIICDLTITYANVMVVIRLEQPLIYW